MPFPQADCAWGFVCFCWCCTCGKSSPALSECQCMVHAPVKWLGSCRGSEMSLSSAKPTPAPSLSLHSYCASTREGAGKVPWWKEKGNTRKRLEGVVWKEPHLFLSGIFSRDVKIRACFKSEMWIQGTCVRDQTTGLLGSGTCPCPTAGTVAPRLSGKTFHSCSTLSSRVQPAPHCFSPPAPILWPGASAGNPGRACVDQDHAQAVKAEPSASLGTAVGADTWSSLAARACMHFWKFFGTISPKVCAVWVQCRQ